MARRTRRAATATKSPDSNLQPDASVRRYVARFNALAPPLRAKIVKVLMRGLKMKRPAAEEAAFHLVDWVVDLEDLSRLYTSSRWKQKNAWRVLAGFVAHVPAHLVAAYRIIYDDPVTDIFEIGAVKGTGRAKRKPGSHYEEWQARRKATRKKRAR